MLRPWGMKAGIAGVRFGLGEWMMKRKCLRIVSVVLGISMLMATAGCKKKNGTDAAQGSSDVIPDLLPTNPDGTPHGDYVLDTDPYYSDTTIKLQIPRNENKDREPSEQHFGEMTFLNENIAFAYNHYYELTDAEEEEQHSLDTFDPDELMRYYELLMMKDDSGIAICSESGELLANLVLPANYEVTHLYPLRDGTAIANCFRVNYNETGDGGWDDVLILFDANGEILREEVANPLLTIEVGNMKVIHMENGQFLFYGEDQVYLMDENWNLLKHANLLGWYSDIYEIDGKYYEVAEIVDYYNYDAKSEFKYRELDLNTFTFSEEKALDPNIPPDYRRIVNNGEVFTDDGEGMVKVNLLTGDRENLFRWGDTDIYGVQIYNARLLSSGDIVLLTSEAEVITLHKEATNPYAGRRILKVGVNEISDYYYEVIRSYNKRPESLGRLYVYFPDRNPYGFDAALKADAADRLLLDMKSGDGPDILINYSDYGQFNSDAILVDLNQYIDGDRGLDRSLYYDNIFRAFEDDGKLFQMPITVTISMLIGNPDILGSVSSWTNTEFGQKMRALPDGMNPILYNYIPGYTNTEPLTGMGLLMYFLYHDMSQYVDYSRGVVNFDSDDFRMLLENAKLATPKITQETFEDLWNDYCDRSYGDPVSLMMQDGICAMTPVNLRNLQSTGDSYKVCNGQAVRVGWPTVKGDGLAAEAQSSVAISSFSTAKDESWDFVRYLMSPEVQMSIGGDQALYAISVTREREEASLRKEIEDFPKDLEKYGGPDSSYAASVPVLDDALANEFIALIERISTKVCKNPTIMEIVREEVPAYFDGSKSAEDVSRIIQSRASTVMAESQ